MDIRLIYHNGNGKRIVKDFSDPMEIIGYIYRCWASARNAASAREIQARLDSGRIRLLEEAEDEQ